MGIVAQADEERVRYTNLQACPSSKAEEEEGRAAVEEATWDNRGQTSTPHPGTWGLGGRPSASLRRNTHVTWSTVTEHLGLFPFSNTHSQLIPYLSEATGCRPGRSDGIRPKWDTEEWEGTMQFSSAPCCLFAVPEMNTTGAPLSTRANPAVPWQLSLFLFPPFRAPPHLIHPTHTL